MKQDGKEVAYATGIDFDEDFELQGIRTLGFHGDRGFKSMGYSCNFSVNTFVLIGGAIEGALKTPTRKSILTQGVLDFEIIDLVTKKTLYIAKSCKCGGKSTSLDATALATKTTRWRAVDIIPNEANVS